MNPSRTPPAPSHDLVAQQETPSRPRQNHSIQYRAGHLSDARSVVIEDLGEIPLVSVDFFTSNVLPPICDKVLGKIEPSLVAMGHIKENRWSAFSQSPKATGLVETEAFKAFPNMVNHILQTASALIGSKPTLEFVYKPYVAPVSERNNATRPDGQLEVKKKKSVGFSSSGEKSHWEDIVLPCEFKLDENDNVSKLIWSAHHIMRTDPLRRFTFGITVEDTQMRLWFFARSHAMVTHSFDFLTEFDIVIRIFAGLAFADDESLGFDSTVSRILVDNRIRYKYEVDGKSYITTRTLADHATDFIRGRGTRVFEAHHEDNASRLVVVKDVWLEDDRIVEGVHLENIRSAIKEIQTEGKVSLPGVRDPTTYFLTVVAHERVKVGGQTLDHTTDVMMRGSGLPSNLEYFSTSKSKVPQVAGFRVIESNRGYSVGHTPVVSRDISALMLANVPRKVRRFQARIHYRIVFEEVGKTIHDLCNLSEVFRCLADATTALEIMHIVGYVHRDVSAGNILFWNGKGLLSDLESVKKTSDLSTHEVRTGTNQYESIEVREHEYLFTNDVGYESDESDNNDESNNNDEKDNENCGSDPPFKFNCLHDLESAWWIALWVLFHHVPLGDDGDHSAQTKRAAEMFPSVGTSSSRATAFMGGIKNLHDLSSAFRPIAELLKKARALLVRSFRRAEKGSYIDETAFVDIHKKLGKIWHEAQKKSIDIEYRFVLQAKRGATDEADDEASAIPSKRPRFNLS